MNLPFRKRSGAQTNPIIPEMNGPVQPVSGPSINWTRLVPAVVAGLVILGALIWIGVWTADKLTSQPKTVATTSQPAKSGNSQQSSSSPANQRSASSPGSNTSTSGNKSSTTPQTTGQQQAQNGSQPQTANGNLTNSGPGDVVAVFLITTLAGAGLYHAILRKRLA